MEKQYPVYTLKNECNDCLNDSVLLAVAASALHDCCPPSTTIRIVTNVCLQFHH